MDGACVERGGRISPRVFGGAVSAVCTSGPACRDAGGLHEAGLGRSLPLASRRDGDRERARFPATRFSLPCPTPFSEMVCSGDRDQSKDLPLFLSKALFLPLKL